MVPFRATGSALRIAQCVSSKTLVPRRGIVISAPGDKNSKADSLMYGTMLIVGISVGPILAIMELKKYSPKDA